jgi:hypothetical protein
MLTVGGRRLVVWASDKVRLPTANDQPPTGFLRLFSCQTSKKERLRLVSP